MNLAALLGGKKTPTTERFVFLEGNIFTLSCHRSTLMGFYFDGFLVLVTRLQQVNLYTAESSSVFFVFF